MKLSELRPCDNCGGPVGTIFNVVRITRAFVAPRAANQTLGLMQMFGGHLAIAEALTPEADCVKIAGDENEQLMTELLICQDCYMMKDMSLPLLETKRGEEPP